MQPHHRQDRLHLAKKRSCFLPYLPQGETNSHWHFLAFLIFNSTVVGGWPWWAGMEKFSSGGAKLPAAGQKPSQRRPQPALLGTTPLVPALPGLLLPLHTRGCLSVKDSKDCHEPHSS